ncbi:MAG: glycerate kinase [Verrucomicrobia bacterium]|nr:glycerate kinase [Verrucomicrobiota bacterium]
MGFKVLIAPDKFKGTLTARAAADAMARGWRRARPDDEIAVFPISDGGDGFGELVSAGLGAVPRKVLTVDAAHRTCNAEWWWEAASRTAIIEAARINGLAMLPPARYHPFELDTFGLGAVFRAAMATGARRCLVGLGGSATNDGGFGLARALGWVFLNERGQVIERWTELHALSQFSFPERERWFEEVLVAVDVQNVLLGPAGCTRVYGPQKGVRPEDFEFCERCLGRLAEVARRELHFDAASEPGAGAAGGLGFGLRCFLNARLESGFGLFARSTGLEARLREAQLVVTGEGAIDASTLMGKGVGELAARCRAAGVPCVGLAGVVADAAQASQHFQRTYALVPEFVTRERAFAEAATCLEELAEKAAREFRQDDQGHRHEGKGDCRVPSQPT